MAPNEPPSVSVCLRGSSDPGSDPLRNVVWIRGEHDISTRVHLSGVIAPATRLDGVDVVVDLSGVTFMDGSTIGAIVEAHNRLRASSQSLSVRAPSLLARRLFDVCGLAFLIDEDLAPARPPMTTALESWIAVPVSERAADSAQPPVVQQTPHRQESAHTPAQRRGEPAGSVQQREAPS